MPTRPAVMFDAALKMKFLSVMTPTCENDKVYEGRKCCYCGNFSVS